ncbi:hypothetical protein D3C80_858340 [compost metagenome]
MAQVDAADGVFQAGEVEAAAPHIIGQPGLAHRRQRQEAQRGGGVGDLGARHAGRHRQTGRLAVHYEATLGVGEAHGQEGGGGADIGQGS